MPGPTLGDVWTVDEGDGRLRVRLYAHLWSGRVGPHRQARAERMLRQVVHGWRCRWCGEDVPTDRRTDAEFCRERCRKAEARQRRKFRRRVVVEVVQ